MVFYRRARFSSRRNSGRERREIALFFFCACPAGASEPEQITFWQKELKGVYAAEW
jgi:hypothetical protein